MQISLKVWPRGIACVNSCTCTCIRVYVRMLAHLRDRHPPHLFVFRSRMPVRKLRRLRRNPRRRHRDFRQQLISIFLSPSLYLSIYLSLSLSFPITPIKALISLMSQVGWVKADTKAIQAIHDHVITHNQRVSVSHSDHSMWNLHIKGVQKEDGGLYMCQINTDPMKSQVCTSLSFYKRYGPIYTG